MVHRLQSYFKANNLKIENLSDKNRQNIFDLFKIFFKNRNAKFKDPITIDYKLYIYLSKYLSSKEIATVMNIYKKY